MNTFPPEKRLVIWSLRDGKAGHASQIAGLIQALGDLMAVSDYAFPVVNSAYYIYRTAFKRFNNAKGFPPPDLIIGAGHRSHWAVLAAKRTFGGRSLLLMKPSLPKTLFDLCIIPEHDNVPAGKNTIMSQGALNPIRYQIPKDKTQGLMLIGGTSRHLQWNTSLIAQQISTVCQQSPTQHWTLLTSRRTPQSMLDTLLSMQPAQHMYTVLTPEQCPSSRYKTLLEKTSTVWATQDSISMIYEALTAGASLGIFPLTPQDKRIKTNKHSVDKLINRGWGMRYQQWQTKGALPPPSNKLNEAARCAKIIVNAWFKPYAANDA